MMFTVQKGRKGLLMGELRLFLEDKVQVEKSPQDIASDLKATWLEEARSRGFERDGEFHIERQGDLLRQGVHVTMVAFMKRM
jgi:hypothetical protein